MTRIEVIDRLRSVEPALRQKGIAALYLYGSYARDQATDDSDSDVLVDFAETRGVGLIEYMAPYHVLEGECPGIEIGYGTRENIVPRYRSSIEQGAVRVF